MGVSLSELARGNPTAEQNTRNEKKNERGVCRIQKRCGSQGFETVGCGSLVKLQMSQSHWIKYAIITSNKVFQRVGYDVEKYCVDFKKSESKFETFELHGAVSGPILQDPASGLTVIPLNSRSTVFHHAYGPFKKKCSVLKHSPFTVEFLPEDQRLNQNGLCCHMVADNPSSNRSFGVKTHELTQDSSCQFTCSSFKSSTHVPLGAAILRREGNEWSLVGILNPDPSHPEVFLPVWLSSEMFKRLDSAADPKEQPGVQPGVQSGDQLGDHPRVQPGVQPVVQPGDQLREHKGGQPEDHPRVQPGVQAGMQLGVQPGVQAGVQLGVQPGVHTGGQPEDHPRVQPGVPPEELPGVQPGDQPGAQSGAQPGELPGVQPGVQPGDQPGAQPGDQLGAQPGDQLGAQPGDQLGAQPGDQLGELPAVQPGAQPGEWPGDDTLDSAKGTGPNSGEVPYVGDVVAHAALMDDLAGCLDKEYKMLKYWKHMACNLKIPLDVRKEFEVYFELSPTVHLFPFMSSTLEPVTVKKLRKALRDIYRNDLVHKLQGFKDADKVDDVFENNPSLLDSIAIELDSAKNQRYNWITLSKKLISNGQLFRDFEAELQYQSGAGNPTSLLFQYLGKTTRFSHLTVHDLKEKLEKMPRKDVLKVLTEAEVQDCSLLTEVFHPDSDLLNKISALLNKNCPGVKGWRYLAFILNVPNRVYEEFEGNLPKRSPTKLMLEWLKNERPEMTVDQLRSEVEKIDRADVLLILDGYSSSLKGKGVKDTEKQPKMGTASSGTKTGAPPAVQPEVDTADGETTGFPPVLQPGVDTAHGRNQTGADTTHQADENGTQTGAQREFKNLLQQLYQAAEHGFENLKRECHLIELSSLDLDERIDFCSFEVDGTSKRLLPASRASRYVPLKTTGDGNCLFRAASIFAFGHENRHEEMRVRTVIELAVNSEFYLKDKDIMGRIDAQERALDPGSKRKPSQIKPDLVKTVFENDVLQTARLSSWASFWHLQALAAVLNRVVQSVYPECGASEVKKYFDVVIWSRKCDQDKEPLAIMWTHTTGGDASNFIPNHFVPLISSDKITSFRKDSGPTSVKKECTLNITLATNAEGWNITANHQLVTELAKNPRVKVHGLVPRSTQEQRDQAKKLNIQLVNAKEWIGFSQKELLAHPPDSLDIDVLIIHSYGRELGKQAQSIKETKKCKWIHVVHTISEELEKYKSLKKELNSHTAEDPKELSEHELQLALCQKADMVVAIGPKVADAYRSALSFCKKHVINLTPEIVHDLVGVRPERDDGEVFRVAIHVKYPAKYFKIKGCDIAARVITLLQDSLYHLMFIVLPTDNVEDLECQLKAEGVKLSQFTVKTVSRSSEDKKKLLCEVDLIIMPSAEGFGNSCLCAISADLPVIISRNSGFGMALNKLPSGGKHVLDSEDPQVWADKIREIREKGPEKRALEARQLRREYTEAYSWKDQCDRLVDKMFEMFPSKQVGKRISVEHAEEIEKTVEQEGDNGTVKKSVEEMSSTNELTKHYPEQEEDIGIMKTSIEETGLTD